MTPRVWNKRDPNAPKEAIYVGRPTKWGNPFKLAHEGERQDVLRAYEEWLMQDRPIQRELRTAAKRELCGKDLVCWCAPKPCHADILLKVANVD